MSITTTTGNNYLMANIPLKSTLDELDKWMEFTQKVLQYSLQDRSVYLFTLSPQEYSFGYQLASFEESKFHKEKILVNFLEKMSNVLIAELIKSEEFTRGLLKIVVSNKRQSFDDLRFVKGDYTNLSEELVTLEDDGTELYWFNPHLPINQAQQKLNEFLYNDNGAAIKTDDQ
jgi:hypothetical protein